MQLILNVFVLMFLKNARNNNIKALVEKTPAK